METQRKWWIERIHAAWQRRPVVWLTGLRRMGKTTLAKQLQPDRYINCDLPSQQTAANDPELFLDGCSHGQMVVLDEIHRLADPALLLKLAADSRPDLRMLATGSSTLAASKRFSDSLTGRKTTIHLPSILWHECLDAFADAAAFAHGDRLTRRLLHGGFPDQLLAPQADPEFFEEWIESYFARDLQELYGLRDRHGYRQLLSYLACMSGGQLSVSDVASAIDLSRPTVINYLNALEDSHAITRLPPYHGGGSQEVSKRPRCFVRDTGLVAHLRGWGELSDGRDGLLWEHLVLDHLLATEAPRRLHYWRARSGAKGDAEIDFVIDHGAAGVDAIEAKINPDRWQPRALTAFRQRYPQGRNIIVSPHRDAAHRFQAQGMIIDVHGLL